MIAFSLDNRLSQETFPVARLGLCELRLMDDRRWPWLILVPQRAGVVEIHELSALDQTMLTFEAGIAAEALKAVTGCDKINSGALGNVVRQLHLHLVARNPGDPGWPKPVWGYGEREPYDEASATAFRDAVRRAIST
jgi:diadenosine tetraphosphate (Ap4A) HIT family hydrolase